jgi:hypothetical protein
MDGRPSPTMTSRRGCVLGADAVISQRALSSYFAAGPEFWRDDLTASIVTISFR